jgi:predicted Kef-type K+ transport protein
VLHAHAGRRRHRRLLAACHAVRQAAATVAAILLLGRYVFGPLLRSAVRTGSRELIMAITLLIVIGISAVTSAVGLSGALGAFMACCSATANTAITSRSIWSPSRACCSAFSLSRSAAASICAW